MIVRVAGGGFRVVADAEQEGGQREAAIAIHRAGGRDRESKCSTPQVVREDVQVFMAEVHTEPNDVPAMDEREIVAILVGVLDLLQRMAKSVLTQRKEVIARPGEGRRSEINGVARDARNSERGAGNILRTAA